jgi:hypothetical protein
VNKGPGNFSFIRITLFQIYIIVAIIAFVVLALLAHTSPFFAIEVAITRMVQSLRSPSLDLLMQLISWPGYNPQWILMKVAVVVFIYAAGFRWEAVMTGLCAGSAQLLSWLLKAMIQRPRPSPELVDALENLSNFGFPVGMLCSIWASSASWDF